MRALVTGCAGCIGSHLSEALLAAGHEVVGIDALTPYYDPRIKRANLAGFLQHRHFTWVEGAIQTVPLADLLRGVTVVYHLAGQPGVLSFGPHFREYVEQNILATQQLLEASKSMPQPPRFMLASSSSVYGDAPRPFSEAGEARPLNPYGITKLAAEHLCLQYHAQGFVPAMAFRFFSVYGPRQRPDMAFNALARAILRGTVFSVRGTGEQLRDFTEVSDIVRVLVVAADKDLAGLVINLGGGHTVTLNDAIALLEGIAGQPARIERIRAAAGEMAANEADTSLLRRTFGFVPATTLEAGLRREFAWVKEHLALLP